MCRDVCSSLDVERFGRRQDGAILIKEASMRPTALGAILRAPGPTSSLWRRASTWFLARSAVAAATAFSSVLLLITSGGATAKAGNEAQIQLPMSVVLARTLVDALNAHDVDA